MANTGSSGSAYYYVQVFFNGVASVNEKIELFANGLNEEDPVRINMKCNPDKTSLIMALVIIINHCQNVNKNKVCNIFDGIY